MNNSVVCPAASNPYSNNPDARETSRSQKIIEGRIYTKLSYALTIHGRVIRIIQVIALAILTCFSALAFRKTIQRLWGEGFKRLQNAAALIPVGFFNGTHSIKDVENLIMPYLSGRDLLALHLTARGNQEPSKSAMIEQLNSGTITLPDLGHKSVSDAIAFFGARCSEITRLDLKKVSPINDQDIQKIAASFTNLHHLELTNENITDNSVSHFVKLIHLKSLSLTIPSLRDFSFLEHFPQLKSLDLRGCWDFPGGLQFLQNCPLLKTLNLSQCFNVEDISSLQYCPQLEHIDVSVCKIRDFTPLAHCLKLSSLIGLHLTETNQNEDFRFLKRCEKLTHLSIKCKEDAPQDFGFLQYCPQITSLDLSNCSNINNNIDFLFWCQKLTSLNLKNCKVQNIQSLLYCPELINLNLAGSKLVDLNPLKQCAKLQTLDLSGHNILLQRDFSFLEHCSELIHLDFSGCQQFNGNIIGNHCPKLVNLNLSGCHFTNSISFLQHCPDMQTLNLSKCHAIRDFNFLEGCIKLTHLNLAECTALRDIGFLVNYPELTTLDLSREVQLLNDFTPLQNCPKLRQVNLKGCRDVGQGTIATLQRKKIKVLV